jgi:dienelactone hydrolase
MIVCICGSTRFRKEIVEANRALTMQGHIVLAPGVFGHAGDPLTDEEKVQLDELHSVKIDMSGVIYVVNPHGYIGSSTRKEIDYAVSRGKGVLYLEDVS